MREILLRLRQLEETLDRLEECEASLGEAPARCQEILEACRTLNQAKDLLLAAEQRDHAVTRRERDQFKSQLEKALTRIVRPWWCLGLCKREKKPKFIN